MTEVRASPDAAVEPIRVLIVDDHPVVRDGLRAMLEAPGVHVIGEAASGAEARRFVAATPPDIVLMDVRMPDMDGLSATELIKQEQPAVAVIIVTSFESQDFLTRAIAVGAAGYLLKGMRRELLLDSVRIVRDGGTMFDPAMLRGLLNDVVSARPVPRETLDPLTPREREIIQLIARGMTNREIAEQLSYSVATVKKAVQQLIEKLGVSDRTQAAVLAVRAGLELGD